MCISVFWFINADTTQRNDKVVLYKKLKENVEQIKAGTFNTNMMQVVHLV